MLLRYGGELMTRRLDKAVVLSHENAKAVVSILSEYADAQERHRKRTRVPTVGRACLESSTAARALARYITANLWEWVEESLDGQIQ